MSPRTRHAAAAVLAATGRMPNAPNASGAYTGILDFPPVLPWPGFLGVGVSVGRGDEHGRIRAHLERDVRLRADVSTADDLPYMEGCQGT